MKRIILTSIFSALIISSFSQINESISLKIGYPIAVGNNFLNNKNSELKYKGIADIGIDYSFCKMRNFEFGLLFNASFWNLEISDITLFMLTPKLKMDYILILKNIEIKPQIGFGYSNLRFSQPDYLIGEGNEEMTIKGVNENYSGLSMSLASKILLNRSKKLNWYFEIAYEFTRCEKLNNDIVDNSYNRNIQLFYPRIGVIWNFKN